MEQWKASHSFIVTSLVTGLTDNQNAGIVTARSLQKTGVIFVEYLTCVGILKEPKMGAKGIL
jgi:hypothetical protein